MAAVYIFEGIDEQRQLERAKRVADLGFSIAVHYHKPWELNPGNDGLEHIKQLDCNDKCFLRGGDITESRVPGLETK